MSLCIVGARENHTSAGQVVINTGENHTSATWPFPGPLGKGGLLRGYGSPGSPSPLKSVKGVKGDTERRNDVSHGVVALRRSGIHGRESSRASRCAQWSDTPVTAGRALPRRIQ